nr:hypothetical protein CFP56_27167 [Quercus suber]
MPKLLSPLPWKLGWSVCCCHERQSEDLDRTPRIESVMVLRVRFGPLFVVVVLIFAATGGGKGFGAFDLGWSSGRALAMEDREG